jgi:uncharacterized protein (DUF885 family)
VNPFSFKTIALACCIAGTFVSAATAQAPSAQLREFFKASDEAGLKREPLDALDRGDKRYADQFGNYLTDQYFDEGLQRLKSESYQLQKIDRSKLNKQDQLAYDVFAFGQQSSLAAYDKGIAAIRQQMPLDHMNGMHVFFPSFSSGQGAAPFKNLEDYENNVKRVQGFVAYLQRCEQRMREGVKNGYVQPKLVTENMIKQLNALAALSLEQNPFFKPTEKMPASLTPAQKIMIKARYQTMVEDTVLPALKQLRDYLSGEYLSASRDNPPGLVSMRDGDKLYAHLIRQYTTTDMTAEQIYTLGLSEVERIANAMDNIRIQVKFKGERPAFFDFVRDDPQFKPKTREQFIAGYKAINQRVQMQVGKLFITRPKTPFEIRPIPSYMEREQAGAYYENGSPDGKRPGVFYLNTYDLPSRSTMGMETLFLHEAIPGHHFQISLAQENATLPPFMRFGGNTAFAEGWALYAESLGTELGLFKDPWQQLGRLSDEMLRAMRLVIDTGLHTKGWTRAQAIEYFLANNPVSENEARAEVERYIANPGQALAYKIGELKIRELRTRAQSKLGKAFDLRLFHRQVLATGALPMAVLEKKIDAWIAAGGKS